MEGAEEGSEGSDPEDWTPVADKMALLAVSEDPRDIQQRASIIEMKVHRGAAYNRQHEAMLKHIYKHLYGENWLTEIETAVFGPDRWNETRGKDGSDDQDGSPQGGSASAQL